MKKYKLSNSYISDQYIHEGTLYLLKNEKCYKAEALLKRLYEVLENWSLHSKGKYQYFSEYNEIVRIYKHFEIKIPKEYIYKSD